MKFDHQAWLDFVRRLVAEHAVGGKEVLAQMKPIHVQILLNKKVAELNTTSKRLHIYPHDEVGQVRKSKLELEITEMSNWMKEHQPERGDKNKDLER